MFEDWKRAWRDAVESFWRELEDDEGAAPTPERAAAMRRDVRAARSELESVVVDLTRTREQIEAERAEEQRCLRRESMARGIGDDETARIAAEYAVRHAERAGVLERKVEALEDEIRLRRRDVEEMESALRRVEAGSGAAGGVGPGGAGSATGAGAGGAGMPRDPLTAEDEARDREFRRMAREAREKDAERRLEELKRRMR